SNRRALEKALVDIEKELGEQYPLIINGERVTTEEKIVSVNPANKEEVIGYVSKANEDIAEQAMQVADQTFAWWRKSNPRMRADILCRAAAIIRRRKHEFNALLIKVGGKPWNGAVADTAEAIDFLEYYGRQMLALKDGVAVESRAI